MEQWPDEESITGIETVIFRRKNLNKMNSLTNIPAPSFFAKNTIDHILWDTARNCVNDFGFTDCVIYEKDEYRNVLVQRTAVGSVNVDADTTSNFTEIEMGKGILGMVAQTGKPKIINETSANCRLIFDDEERLSQIVVPIFVDGKVFGIINSKHSKKDFHNEYDLKLLERIAVVCAERIFKCLTEEKLRSKIARDLHDNMGSGLSSISIYGQIARLYNDQQRKEELKQILDKINETSSEMIMEMNDIVWAINPHNDNMSAILQRMESFAKPLLASQKISFHLKYYTSILTLRLELTERKNFFLVFKEAINNAIKYSDCTNIVVEIKYFENHFNMTITDNGKGFSINTFAQGVKAPHAIESGGNGLRNMGLRAEEMRGKLNLISNIGTGTTVELCVPIT
jgi:signal transduction histidine kinase